jgi:alpha-acetolactate decarboxylase
MAPREVVRCRRVGRRGATLAAVTAFLAMVALAGCSTARWNGRVATWGSMRDVMRDGRTEGRVALGEAVTSPNAVGLGALEGLRGEIAVLDGVVWICRVDDGGSACRRGAKPGEQATLLALSDVPAWDSIAVDEDLIPEAIAPFLADVARRTGLGDREPWPFVVEGEFVDVESHVLNGECPFAGPVAPEHEPSRKVRGAVRGTLVGYFAPAAVGTLVHHGEAIHVDLLLRSPEVYVGHVDRVTVRAGARLLVPAR